MKYEMKENNTEVDVAKTLQKRGYLIVEQRSDTSGIATKNNRIYIYLLTPEDEIDISDMTETAILDERYKKYLRQDKIKNIINDL